jgi:riboflavin synthase
MFTGIVQDMGRIDALTTTGDWVMTVVTKMPTDDLALGASVSCNGICLTVIEKPAHSFRVQMSAETLDKTTARHWKIGQGINLERALRVGDELGGHYVSGHVDTVTKLMDRQKDGDSERFRFALPEKLAKFIAPKGSITIDGVALTVNDVTATDFGVNIIPHTWTVTTLGALRAGDVVNIEIDMIARYVAQLMVAA